MQNNLTIAQRARRIKLITQTALFVVIGLIGAPIAFFAIKGLLGLIACGIIGTLAITFGPVLGDMAANAKLKLLKAEAARNPIETLDRELLNRQQMLQQHFESIGKLRTKCLIFEGRVGEFAKKYPAQAPQFQKQLGAMLEVLAAHEDRYTKTSAEVQVFSDEIAKASAIWEMSLAAAEAAETTRESAAETFYARIKTETALDAIQEAMTTSFSQLDQLRLENRQVRTQELPETTV